MERLTVSLLHVSGNVLLIGNGGREHAIAEKLLESSHVDQVYMAPGNGAVSQSLIPIPTLDIADTSALVKFVHEHDIGRLTFSCHIRFTIYCS
jgi:phosphoribosylamine-glycine ligase